MFTVTQVMTVVIRTFVVSLTFALTFCSFSHLSVLPFNLTAGF